MSHEDVINSIVSLIAEIREPDQRSEYTKAKDFLDSQVAYYEKLGRKLVYENLRKGPSGSWEVDIIFPIMPKDIELDITWDI